MRNRFLLLLLSCLVMTGHSVASEIMVIEVPSLTGNLTNLDGIAGVIEIPGDIGVVLGATLELSGQAEGGTLHCPDGSTQPWWVFPGAEFDNGCIDVVPGHYLAEFGAVDGGEITVQAPVLWSPSQGSEAPWHCWVGQQVAVALACVWGLPTNGCIADPMPYFWIDEARLLLEYEPVVATANMSWGAVKAVYR
jgi:hypothetical protein